MASSLRADTEDMVQGTFLKLMTHDQQSQSESHEKAWLIVTAANICKDELRGWNTSIRGLLLSTLQYKSSTCPSRRRKTKPAIHRS